MSNASTTVLGRRFAWWEQMVQHRTADTPATWSAYKWWVAGIIMLAAVIVALSFEALTLALPTMMASMRVGLNEMSWTITAYMISRTLFVGIVGWLGNRLGNRNLFALGLALFTGGSLLCGLAWNFEALIVFRVLQGIGAGPLMPLTMVFLQESFPPAQRGLAQGLYLVGDAIGSILGRVLVGYLIDYLGWRGIFYVTVPFGVIALGLLIMLVPNRRETLTQALDPLGSLLLAVFIVCLLVGLHHGPRHGWDSSQVQTLLLLAGLSLGGFVVAEVVVPTPLMDLRLLLSRGYGMISLVSCLNSIGLMGAFFLVPLMLQQLHGYTPLQAGLLLAPGAIAWGLVGLLSGKLSDTMDARLLLAGGFGITIWIALQLATVTVQTPPSTLLWLTIGFFCTTAFLYTPISTVSLQTIPDAELRMGIGMLNLIRGLGWALGIALVSLAIEQRQAHHMQLLTQNQSQAMLEVQPTLTDLQALFQHQGDVESEASHNALVALNDLLLSEASVAAYQECYVGVALLYMLALLPLLALRRRDTAPARSVTRVAKARSER
jgi:DHA2 family multidrug resistance protein